MFAEVWIIPSQTGVCRSMIRQLRQGVLRLSTQLVRLGLYWKKKTRLSLISSSSPCPLSASPLHYPASSAISHFFLSPSLHCSLPPSLPPSLTHLTISFPIPSSSLPPTFHGRRTSAAGPSAGRAAKPATLMLPTPASKGQKTRLIRQAGNAGHESQDVAEPATASVAAA